jgi:hypothetical protein
MDSPLEGERFEPSVPRKRDPPFKSAIQWLLVRHVCNELCDRGNDQVLDAARFKQGNGANEAGFAGHRIKKQLEVRATPSSVPARKSWPLYRKAAGPLQKPPPRRSDTPSQGTIQPHQIARCYETRTNHATVWPQ